MQTSTPTPLPRPAPPAAIAPADVAALERHALLLLALADDLDRAAATTLARAAAARDDWRGCSRRWFDDRIDDLVRAQRSAARSLADDARTLLAQRGDTAS